MRVARSLLLLLLLPCLARAEALRDRFNAGGYFRVMTRPDFQGGSGRLGFWNLYGRLLNEGPYASLELKLDVLQDAPGRLEPWTSVHAKIEGGSVGNADASLGALSSYRLSQLYVKAGNVLLDKVAWQLGTLDSYFGDLGLYDQKPAQLFSEAVGLSALYSHQRFDLLLGLGDSGFASRGRNYNTLLTGGGTVRVRLGSHLEVGTGGQYVFEPEVKGNQYAPHQTPGLRYEDFLRQEVARRFVEDNPTVGSLGLFSRPESRSADSWKVVGYLGFGGFGPVRWNNLFANFLRRHPDVSYKEQYQGRDYLIYVKELTDERYEVNVGNELQLELVPGRLDAAWGILYGYHFNSDNTLAPGDDNRVFYSSVLRLQLYLSRTVHLLAEGSGAQEISLQGNLYREHVDSVFGNSGGVADSRGLELGDSDRRNTVQLKGGLVFNPTGLGIYTRPSLRLLYGAQYSSQQAAFGSGFVDDLSQYALFAGPERHWHHLVAVEAEAWF